MATISELDEADTLPLTQHVLASRAINHKLRRVLTHCALVRDFLILLRKTSLSMTRIARQRLRRRAIIAHDFRENSPQVRRAATIVYRGLKIQSLYANVAFVHALHTRCHHLLGFRPDCSIF